METLYCQCGQRITCFHNVFSKQIEFLFRSPERPILWCPNCTRRLKYGELHEQPPKRKPIVITTYRTISSVLGSARRPWHAPYLEIHLMGIARSMFRDCLLSDRYNQAVSIEWMYERIGLVLRFGLN